MSSSAVSRQPASRGFSRFNLRTAPPHALVESKSCYSIVFNMLGIGRRGIGIEVNPERREVTVLARRADEHIQGGFLWIFGVPEDGLLNEMKTRYRGGALEVVIPKESMLRAVGA